MKVCFIVTNFNNSYYTQQMLKSLLVSDLTHLNVVIVDNSSSNDEICFLNSFASEYTDKVTVLYNKSNIGYFRGLNLGIKYARNHFFDADYYIIGNNDIIFPDNFASQLALCKKAIGNYPVVSPNIRMLDGTPQNPHVISHISKKREFLYDLYHSNYLLALFIIRLAKFTRRFTDRKDELQHDIAQEIYQGYGACYILTPKFFENFTELWAPTFLMYEEFFLSRQLEEKGFKIYYEPRISVTHYCKTSTGTLPSKLKWEYSRQAHKEYRKYVKVFCN